MSLSLGAVLLDASFGDGIVEEELLDDDGVPVLGVDAVPVLDELDVSVDGVVVDGVVLLLLGVVDDVLGDMVEELELEDGGVVVEGVVVVDDVVPLSRWQPATPIAAAIARTAHGFRFM
ncbi:MAG TPA: hypothetical protein VMB76_10285 [Casimicrobiaceae bacterium]|nr:hypothetical protein [Casimicrobiaceae bacterium]